MHKCAILFCAGIAKDLFEFLSDGHAQVGDLIAENQSGAKMERTIGGGGQRILQGRMQHVKRRG